MAADVGVVLIDTVIVYKYRGCTNIRFLTHGGITDIGQVRNLRTAANLRILSFDETAKLAAFAQVRARTDEGKRADVSIRANDGLFPVGADNLRAAPDLHIGQGGIWADDSVIVDVGGAPQLSTRVDQNIATNGHIHTNPSAGWVDDGRTVAHCLLNHAGVKLRTSSS